VLAFASYEGQGNVQVSKHTVMVINAVFEPRDSGRPAHEPRVSNNASAPVAGANKSRYAPDHA